MLVKISFRGFLLRLVLSGAVVLVSSFAVFARDNTEEKRELMVDVIRELFKATESYTGDGLLSDRVAHAMLAVPRHKFVAPQNQPLAYDNTALHISHQQTISQPYIVALMTELANVNQDSVVLEVGTGSGYQAAVLSGIVDHVYSIEIIEPLGLKAQALLKNLGYDNITVRIGDGYFGWPERAPFDAILVTAAAQQVPEQLLFQLKPGGRLIIPIGERGKTQALRMLVKGADGEIKQRDILPVAFVPLTGGH